WDVRHDAEPAADLSAGRRAHPVRHGAALAPADRVRFLVSHHTARTLVVGAVLVGPARAAVVARAPRSPAGARRATAAAPAPALGRAGGAGAVRDHVCAGSLQNLREGGRGKWRVLH